MQNPLIKTGIECVPAVEWVKIRPEMYWGTLQPKASDALQGMVEQLAVLGCDDIKTLIAGDWYYVGSRHDWLKSGLDKAQTLENLFGRSYGFPEAGETALRTEFFLSIFAENLLVWRNQRLTNIKGEYTVEQRRQLEANFYDGVAVAFNGNVYETNA
ncbi:hypothetical protein [Methylovulum psychrotolerans]|uniref:Uncharacterized protein n=1 Tax=Methylovulum psychrotolerans TaxID=1704499 RepID=A0A2S5CNV7_9GAMM|nr:hypothetical protein [Methylovulum psychrotolerans]POZ52422.1 hypothetical protein AADEFJLK_01904 [Methylovulum psychrotolerans]